MTKRLLTALLALSFLATGCSAGGRAIPSVHPANANAKSPRTGSCVIPADKEVHVMTACVQCDDGTWADVCASAPGSTGNVATLPGGGGGCYSGTLLQANQRSARGCVIDGGVALLSPDPGTHCYDSQAAIGENVPPNTTDSAHSVASIDKIVITLGNASEVTGYVYHDQNNQLYISPSPGYLSSGGSFWAQLVSTVPIVGQMLSIAHNNMAGAFAPISPADLANIKSHTWTQQPGGSTSITGCFKARA